VTGEAWVWDSNYVDSVSCRCDGNERMNRLASEAVQGDTEFVAFVWPSDFRPLSRVRMLDSWQCSWSEVGMGRYTCSILPLVSLVPWFRRFDSNRCVVTSMNRMMSNHSCLRCHLGRINIVESLLCICLEDDRSRNVELRKIWLWKVAPLEWLKGHWDCYCRQNFFSVHFLKCFLDFIFWAQKFNFYFLGPMFLFWLWRFIFAF
jgi:hypothetical protein